MNLKDKIFKKIWEGKTTSHIAVKKSRTEPYRTYKKYIIETNNNSLGSSTFARKKISVWNECIKLLPDNFIGLEFGVFEGRSINFIRIFFQMRYFMYLILLMVCQSLG